MRSRKCIDLLKGTVSAECCGALLGLLVQDSLSGKSIIRILVAQTFVIWYTNHSLSGKLQLSEDESELRDGHEYAELFSCTCFLCSKNR